MAARRLLGMEISIRKSGRGVPERVGKWCSSSAVPVSLLLSMAPNVVSLQLTISFEWKLDGLARKLPNGAFVPKITFPSLAHLRLAAASEDPWKSGDYHLAWWDVTAESHDAMCGLLAASPGLKSLELYDMGLMAPLNPPTGLTSLVLFDTTVDIARMAETTPQLRRLCIYFKNRSCGAYDLLDDMTDRLLGPLSQLAAAQTLEVLSLWGSKLDATHIPVLARFPALKLLAITCEREAQDDLNNVLIIPALLRACSQLQGLVVHGAERVGRPGLLALADGVSKSELPRLRKIKLVPREIWDFLFDPIPESVGAAWESLRRVAGSPLASLLRAGDVEVIVRKEDRKHTTQPFEEMEQALFAS